MRQNYNYFKYWENIINENKTIRGHMFMNEPPKEKSLYVHTLIFTKNSGIENIYAYFPDVKVLLGYIQYSFLQEAFYKWIHGKKRMITKIPYQSVKDIVDEGLKIGLITDEISKTMMSDYNRIMRMWELPKDRILSELMKFTREFNKTWFGNNKEFLYIKIFKTPLDLGNFVVESTMITGDKLDFKNKVGVTIEEWISICENSIKDKKIGKEFKRILQKNLTEVL